MTIESCHHHSSQTQQLKVISFFSGCGGSSLGYKLAGCKILLACDWEKKAVETYKLNFPNTKVIQADIRSINKDNIFELSDRLKEPGELDILDGSPPCTPFSICGKRYKTWGKSYIHSGDSNKQRTDDLFFEYIRLIQILKPKLFIAENVKGLIIGKSKGYFKNIIREMKELTNNEYYIQALLVNAKDFEVPQSRERIVIYGIRNDIFIDKNIKLKTYPEISFAQATRDLQIPKEEIEAGYRSFNNSGYKNYYLILKAGESVSKYHPRENGFNHYKLILNKPSFTITTHSMHELVHPLENRYITLSECKRLASFPDYFKFLSKIDGVTRIGNSVPPKLMYHIVKYLLEKTNNLSFITNNEIIEEHYPNQKSEKVIEK